MKLPLDSLWLIPLFAAAVLRRPEDDDLARRLRNRDASVVSELYDRYGRIAFTLIFRIVHDRALAEDLVQECFLRVWTRSHAFDAERGALGPWILAVARNQALDYIRSVQGRVWNSMASADSEHPNAFLDWEGDMLDGVRLQQVRSALEKLSDKQRAVIELVYFEGLSHTEMAERMKEPLGTVKTWVRTALQALRDELTVVAQV